MVEEIEIARLGASGDGVAETPGGPLYVSYALPGERVAIEREGTRGNLVRVETASPDRVQPFCPYFGRCGGCAAQHVGPALYGGWKRDTVKIGDKVTVEGAALAKDGSDAAGSLPSTSMTLCPKTSASFP